MRWLRSLLATMTGRDMPNTPGDRLAQIIGGDAPKMVADTSAPSTIEAVALFHLDALDAAKHARCGPKSLCRVTALKRVDEDLDAWLAAAAIGG